MKKLQLFENTDEIKQCLNVKYHDLIDHELQIIKTNFVIKNNNYFKSPFDTIKYLSNYYSKVPYYKEVLKESKKINIPFHSTKSDINTDFILLEFIKHTKNIVPILLWPTVASKDFMKNKKSKKFIEFLKKNGKIIITKYFQLTKKQSESFLFQLYSTHSYFKIYQNLLYSLKMKNFVKDEKNDLMVIFWIPNDNNYKYFGNGTDSIKHKMKNILLKSFKNNFKDNSKNEEQKLKETMHIVNSNFETIELAQMIFNNNTLESMKYQRMDILIGKYRKFTRSIMILNLFKKILYTKFDFIDINRVLIFSSFVLFSLGLRNFNDIDAFVYHYPKYEDSKTTNLKQIIDDFVTVSLGGDNRQIIEFIVKGYGDWTFDEFKEYPHKWLEKTLPKKYGANTFENVIFHPKFHFYFLGLKAVIYQGDFARRSARNRPSSIADLIAINRMTHFKINILKIPKTIWVNHKEIKVDEDQKNNIILKIQKRLRYRYSIFMDINQIKKVFNNP